MQAICILGFIFGLTALPFALPAFFRVLHLNREVERLRTELQALKTSMQIK